MEKAMSVEERIRRAEERYNRKMGNTSFEHSTEEFAEENGRHAKKKSKRKVFSYILICILIYIVYYAIANGEYIFSTEFKKDVNSFFTEKTKIYEIYTDIKSNFIKEENKNQDEESKESEQQNNDKENTEQQSQEQPSSEQQNSEQVNNEVSMENTNSENVGGAEEIAQEEINRTNEEIINEETPKEEVKEKTQMEKDVDEIKFKLSFINPIEGRISSTFGWRNPTVATVPKYHTGLDIAANTGTVIKSATDGTIEVASSDGAYGKHYFIKYDNITVIYAHCSKLYLKQGTTVKQGQEIAEVGSTGNSTGPHLHIGIKLDDRWVDPQLILNI